MADEDKLEQETFEIAELYQEQTESSYNQALKRIGKNKDLAKIIHPEVGTLLHLACKYNLLSHVKVLVKNNADVNAHGGKLKNKPLHEALFNPNKVKRKVSRRSQHNESFEIVKHLLDNGAEVNAVNKYSTTPLHSCCIEGLADCAKLLLDKNADFTLKAGKAAKESTPLHFAAEYGWASVAKILLDRGADHLVENSEGKTPYQVAVESTLIFDEAMRKAVCNVFDKDLNQVDLSVNTPRDDNDTDLDGNGIEMGNNNNNNNNNNNKQKMEDEGENNKEPKGTGCGCTII